MNEELTATAQGERVGREELHQSVPPRWEGRRGASGRVHLENGESGQEYVHQ